MDLDPAEFFLIENLSGFSRCAELCVQYLFGEGSDITKLNPGLLVFESDYNLCVCLNHLS